MKPLTHSIIKTLVLALISVSIVTAATESSAEKEVLATLDVWKEAVMRKDRATLEKVYHPDLTYAHSNGLVENKDQQIHHMIESKAAYEAIPTSDTRVHVYGNVALVATRMDFHQNTAGNREIVNLQVLMVWLKGPEGWQMIGRQSTRPGAK